MSENYPKLSPEAASSDHPFPSLILGGLCDRLSALRPPLPRAVPMTQKRDDGIYYLIGVRFDTEAEAQNFALGIEGHCDVDGQRLFFKRSWQATTQLGQAIWPS
jgi:hypothetical protein